ncbi:MAG: HPr family phosphocarrier protein [Candidatus Marinimicrobia bacterium]|nr:HPr family phosphocarrier protein [Candidatus Neomarinimicrobiota bacterium]
MFEQEFEILNEQGLHARPATALVNTIQKYKSEVFLLSQGKKINAKSILGVLVLAAEKGSKMIVQANGEDAEEAVNSVLNLAANKFGMPNE